MAHISWAHSEYDEGHGCMVGQRQLCGHVSTKVYMDVTVIPCVPSTLGRSGKFAMLQEWP